MTIVWIILAIIAALIVLALVLAAIAPKEFRVARSTTIAAPADRIIPLIDDFHNWPQWSPFEKLDPAVNRTYEGAPSGKGAVYAWSGNSRAGAGRMEIVDERAPSAVTIDLQFLKPMKAQNVAEFTLVPEGDATNVTWAMSGKTPFVGRIMHMVFNMDKMVGGMFAEGLASMKAVAER